MDAGAPARARRVRVASHALASLCLALTAWHGDLSARHDGPAFDEPLHLAAGAAHWASGELRLDQGSGVLPQLWAALPLRLAGASLDDRSSAWAHSDPWGLGRALLYEGGRDPAAVLRPARRMVLALAIAQGALVYAWSLSLFGLRGAWISLALHSLCPNVLAHARLATSDVATALAFGAAVLAAGWMLARPSAGRVAVAGLAAGLLLLCKATSLLFAPMLALLALWQAARAPRALPARTRVGAPLAAAGALLAIALAVVWIAYGVVFRPSDAAVLDWSRVDAAGGALPALLRGVRASGLLPEVWLSGIGFAFATTRERVAFAAGAVGSDGWWWYFPYCVAVKTPLGTLALLALAAAAGARALAAGRDEASPRRGAGAAPALVLLAVYAAASLGASLNIGMRHLLPMLPAAFVLAGAASRWCGARWGRVAVGVCLAATAVESLAAYPRYLSFFNRAAGGPAAGYRLLVDSNLDWGQDLPALAAWRADRRARGDATPCRLSWFGSALPERHGVDCARLPGFFDAAPELRATELAPGDYVVSATMLPALYLEPELRGAWGARQQQRLDALEALLATELSRASPERARLEALRLRMRFAKLLDALRAREPDERIAWSLLVYRVGAGELESALAARPAPVGHSSAR